MRHRILAAAVFFVGINLAVSNNNLQFHLHGWAQFGVGCLAIVLVLAGFDHLVRIYK